MKTRIAKFIADSGIASRREAEKLIADGKVFVNGARIDTPVFFVDGSEKVIVNGRDALPARPESGRFGETSLPIRLFAFHKPINTITSTSDPQGRKTIYDVLAQTQHSTFNTQHLKYIGRLDYKTTGLLLLTNDGALAREMTLPSSGLKRVYIAHLHPKKIGVTPTKVGVQCAAGINNCCAAVVPGLRRYDARNQKALRNFLSPLNSDDTIFDAARSGATIDGVKYAPMDIEVLSRYPLSVKLTLTEGKKNEIRIVMAWLGFMVKKLHRISYGNYELGDLKPGEIKELTRL
jgi:23S rRNA pseudouridine2605 synthase